MRMPASATARATGSTASSTCSHSIRSRSKARSRWRSQPSRRTTTPKRAASCSPITEQGLTRRVAALLARIEAEESGDKGRAREWLARAVTAPRDAAWIADGVTSDRWAPMSPVTGALDAFAWRVPVGRGRKAARSAFSAPTSPNSSADPSEPDAVILRSPSRSRSSDAERRSRQRGAPHAAPEPGPTPRPSTAPPATAAKAPPARRDTRDASAAHVAQHRQWTSGSMALPSDGKMFSPDPRAGRSRSGGGDDLGHGLRAASGSRRAEPAASRRRP